MPYPVGMAVEEMGGDGGPSSEGGGAGGPINPSWNRLDLLC